jgi:predicted transcriptional regulator
MACVATRTFVKITCPAVCEARWVSNRKQTKNKIYERLEIQSKKNMPPSQAAYQNFISNILKKTLQRYTFQLRWQNKNNTTIRNPKVS